MRRLVITSFVFCFIPTFMIEANEMDGEYSIEYLSPQVVRVVGLKPEKYQMKAGTTLKFVGTVVDYGDSLAKAVKEISKKSVIEQITPI